MIAFVASCFSETIGDVLKQAGIPVVISIN